MLLLTGCALGRADRDVKLSTGAKMRIDRYTLKSTAVKRIFDEYALLPEHHDSHTPILVMLHGRGGAAHTWTTDEMVDEIGRLGDRAPIVIGVQSTTASYWHNRSTGDFDSYVVDEVIPDARRRFKTDSARVAIGGHSMGGFGAFDIALHHRGKFCAVGGHEPAIWRSGGETAPGAFDNAEDFNRNDVIAMVRKRQDPFGGAAVQLDYGDQDPFIPGDKALIEAIRSSGTKKFSSHVWPGTHGMAYVRRHYSTTIEFYADALANCTAEKLN